MLQITINKQVNCYGKTVASIEQFLKERESIAKELGVPMHALGVSNMAAPDKVTGKVRHSEITFVDVKNQDGTTTTKPKATIVIVGLNAIGVPEFTTLDVWNPDFFTITLSLSVGDDIQAFGTLRTTSGTNGTSFRNLSVQRLIIGGVDTAATEAPSAEPSIPLDIAEDIANGIAKDTDGDLPVPDHNPELDLATAGNPLA